MADLFYVNNTKVALSLPSISVCHDQVEIDVKENKKEAVCVLISIYEPDFDLSKKINQFDMIVINAVYTLSVNEVTTFTPSDICRLIYGDKAMDVTKVMAAKIEESLDKMMYCPMRIDWTAQCKARHLREEEYECILDGILLPMEKMRIKTRKKHNVAVQYTLTNTPIIFRYAEQFPGKPQIISFPVAILTNSRVKNETSEDIVIKHYLIRRIERMKNPRNHQIKRDISYEWYDKETKRKRGLLAELDIDLSQYGKPRSKKMKIHKSIIGFLEAFQRSGYIDGYSVNKKGTEITGYHILLEPHHS